MYYSAFFDRSGIQAAQRQIEPSFFVPFAVTPTQLGWFAYPDTQRPAVPRQAVDPGYFVPFEVLFAPIGWFAQPERLGPPSPRQRIEPGYFVYSATPAASVVFGYSVPPDKRVAPSFRQNFEPGYFFFSPTLTKNVVFGYSVPPDTRPVPAFRQNFEPGYIPFVVNQTANVVFGYSVPPDTRVAPSFRQNFEPGYFFPSPTLTVSVVFGYSVPPDTRVAPVFRQNFEPGQFVSFAVPPAQFGWYAHPDKLKPPLPKQRVEPASILVYPPVIPLTKSVVFGYSVPTEKLPAPTYQRELEPSYFTPFALTPSQFGWYVYPDPKLPPIPKQRVEPSGFVPFAVPFGPFGWYAYPEQQKSPYPRGRVEPGTYRVPAPFINLAGAGKLAVRYKFNVAPKVWISGTARGQFQDKASPGLGLKTLAGRTALKENARISYRGIAILAARSAGRSKGVAKPKLAAALSGKIEAMTQVSNRLRASIRLAARTAIKTVLVDGLTSRVRLRAVAKLAQRVVAQPKLALKTMAGRVSLSIKAQGGNFSILLRAKSVLSVISSAQAYIFKLGQLVQGFSFYGEPRHRILSMEKGAVTLSACLDLLPPIDAGVEQELIKFDYGRVLTAGTYIVSATVTCAVESGAGTDPTPSARLIGQPVILASPRTGAPQAAVGQMVGNCVADIFYQLQCVAEISDGQSLSLWGRLPCGSPE